MIGVEIWKLFLGGGRKGQSEAADNVVYNKKRRTRNDWMYLNLDQHME